MIVGAPGGAPQLLLRRERPPTPSLRMEWGSWLPNGRDILFTDQAGPGQPWSMHIFSLETRRRRRLTFPPKGSFGDLVAAASPDGRFVAFARYATGSEGDIFIVPAAGGAEPQRVTNNASYHWGIAWTPDSEWLFFSAIRLGVGPALWRLRPRGLFQPEPAGSGGPGACWPSIASRRDGGGLLIAYERYLEGVNVHRWDRLTARPPRVIAPSTRYERAVQFSPDGKLMAFASTASSHGGAREIWISGADGAGLRQITRMNQPFADAPRWSPDGSRLAFSNTDHAGNRDVYVVDVSSGALLRLTKEASEEGRPSWSRDGQWIYFRSTRTGTDQIWKQPAPGGGASQAPVQVTRHGGYEGFESPDGRWLYFAKDRSHEGLWKLPTAAVGGGVEQPVVDSVREGLWGVAIDGLYFLRFLPQPALWTLPFHSRKPVRLAPVEVRQGGIASGLAVRYDGESFAWPQTTGIVSDVMLLAESR